jgi:hypothetical protein
MRVNTQLLRGDESNIIPSYKKEIRKKAEPHLNNFVLYLPKQLKYIRLNNQASSEEEYPMNKWIMPPQPQRYIRYSDHDFL